MNKTKSYLVINFLNPRERKVLFKNKTAKFFDSTQTMFLDAAIKCPPLGRHYLQKEMHHSELAMHIELLIIKQFTFTVIRT